MEFQFRQTAFGIKARCSMEQAAFANWFNSEIQTRAQVEAIIQLLEKAQLAPCYEAVIGREYSLFVQGDEVEVRANALGIDADADELLEAEGLAFYDAESQAHCGLEDALRFFYAYLDF